MTEEQVQERCDYVEENGEPGWKCRECGSWIQAKTQARSYHLAEMPLAGSGEVKYVTVCWCPQCHTEPPYHGPPITESIGDSLARGL